MKKQLHVTLLALFLFAGIRLSAQRKVSELTVTYHASVVSTGAEPKIADAFDGATTKVYIKGALSRTDMVSTLATFSTIHDLKTGQAVSLRETGAQKILIRMTADNWKDRNKRYEGIKFTTTTETKQIAGYNCVKATASLQNGRTLTVYYTPDILPENREYDYQFRELPGLPMEYEVEMDKYAIKYTASAVSFNPVPVSRFDIPKTGYRELSYEESIKLRN